MLRNRELLTRGLQRLEDDVLSALPGIQRLQLHAVMKQVVTIGPCPPSLLLIMRLGARHGRRTCN